MRKKKRRGKERRKGERKGQERWGKVNMEGADNGLLQTSLEQGVSVLIINSLPKRQGPFLLGSDKGARIYFTWKYMACQGNKCTHTHTRMLPAWWSPLLLSLLSAVPRDTSLQENQAQTKQYKTWVAQQGGNVLANVCAPLPTRYSRQEWTISSYITLLWVFETKYKCEITSG